MAEKRVPAITEEQCRQRYSDFYKNPAIIELGKCHAWTISDSNKMPVSQRSLLAYGELKGASTYVPEDMLTLDELVSIWPDATNNALYLRDNGRYAILDIEPTATDACKEIMLSTPWIYAEVSMSGKGYHLIIDYPDELLRKYPNARKTTAKHSSGTYEMHLQHWITFTRKTIPKTKKWGTISLEQALSPLCAQQKAPVISHKSRVASLHRRDVQGKSVPDVAYILNEELPEWWAKYVNGSSMILAHTPRNTGGDLSKRDFKFAMFVAHRFIDKSAANGYDTPKFEEVCEVTYKTLCVALTWQGKWRPKNDEMRGEVTYLEATCERAVDLVMSQLDDKNADKEAQIEKECETEQQLEDNMCDDDIMASYEDAQPQDQEERA